MMHRRHSHPRNERRSLSNVARAFYIFIYPAHLRFGVDGTIGSLVKEECNDRYTPRWWYQDKRLLMYEDDRGFRCRSPEHADCDAELSYEAVY